MNAARGTGGDGTQQGPPALRGVQADVVLHSRPRNVSPDLQVQETVQIGSARPTYGTRRMAAQVSRELNRPVNRKAVRRIFRRLGWSEPSRTKQEIIRANKKLPRPNAPNRFWEPDMSYIWCRMDGWGYCFNVIDVFTRQWLAFVLASRATRRHAIMAVNNAVAAANPALPDPTIWSTTDPSTPAANSGHRWLRWGSLEYIYVNTPEQNGHIESFHKALTKEYVWPREFADIREAREAILAAFHYYNHSRIHSALEYLMPSEFAERWQQNTEGARPYGKQIMEGEECA